MEKQPKIFYGQPIKYKYLDLAQIKNYYILPFNMYLNFIYLKLIENYILYENINILNKNKRNYIEK